MQRINISDPAVDRDVELRLPYDGRLFTGEAADADEEPTLLETYAEGLRHGPWCAWYFDGSLRAEGRYREGWLVGEFQKWHENGRLASRKLYSGRVAAPGAGPHVNGRGPAVWPTDQVAAQLVAEWAGSDAAALSAPGIDLRGGDPVERGGVV